MGLQLSTGSCRHRWLPGPAPSPPGRQAAFPQPHSLKPNPSFQLQLQRAWGPALPGEPAACRSHGQGIFPVRCSRRAEPSEQRAESTQAVFPFPFASTRPSSGERTQRAKLAPHHTHTPRSGAREDLENKIHPSRGTRTQRQLGPDLSGVAFFFQLFSHKGTTDVLCP